MVFNHDGLLWPKVLHTTGCIECDSPMATDRLVYKQITQIFIQSISKSSYVETLI